MPSEISPSILKWRECFHDGISIASNFLIKHKHGASVIKSQTYRLVVMICFIMTRSNLLIAVDGTFFFINELKSWRRQITSILLKAVVASELIFIILHALILKVNWREISFMIIESATLFTASLSSHGGINLPHCRFDVTRHYGRSNTLNAGNKPKAHVSSGTGGPPDKTYIEISP